MTEVRSPKHTTISLSVFVKCVLILTVATALVAGVISVMSDRKIRDTAGDGLRQLAESVTGNQASQLAAAVRFGKIDDVSAALETFVENENARVLGAVVVSAGGEVLTSVGALPADHTAQLVSLAEAAIATGQNETTGDGFWRASPMRAGENSIAGLAIAWTPATTLAQIDAQRWRQLSLAGGIFLGLTIACGLFFRQALALPLRRLARRTTELADGDLDSPIPDTHKRDEIGQTALQLEFLREKLAAAQVATRNARFQSAGFESASVPLLMTDRDHRITHTNAAFERLCEMSAGLLKLLQIGSGDALIGSVVPLKTLDSTLFADMSGRQFPISTDIVHREKTYHLSLNQVLDEVGQPTGYVMEWNDVTQARVTEAVLNALDAAQIRADFDSDGRLIAVNPLLETVSKETKARIGSARLTDLIQFASGTELTLGTLETGTLFEKFRLDGDVIVSGIISQIRNSRGDVVGYVLLGHDITENERTTLAAEETRKSLERDQQKVVDGLSRGLSALSDGDLAIRLTAEFPERYEALRERFNSSIASIEAAVSVVRDNSANILGEADNISSAADDLSRRTEQQAATLEEFAASLTELTASVAATAEGAGQASEVVISARENAENSGGVVREAVQAMGEISDSSERIGRIISVIDDIAFQTNLLALNAGVEAARAGDAGRGFAVVASEVRALAQRSSEAASEINELISSSSTQVKRGVSLVGRAGDALETIVSSIGGIADHVTTIAASAREQSTGIDEINTAMSQLDQATQQNVAMFEETTAATHALRSEASALVDASHRFNVNEATVRATALSPRMQPQATPHPPASKIWNAAATRSAGNAALAEPDATDDDDWEDF